MKLKILFLPSWYPNEESPVLGIFVKEHAKAVSLFDDVVVLFNQSTHFPVKGIYGFVSDKVEDGIRTIRIKHNKNAIAFFVSLYSTFMAARKLFKEGWRPDVIHCHVYSEGFTAILLGKIYKIPVVITEHFTGFYRQNLKGAPKIKAIIAMKYANKILPVSKSLKSSIEWYVPNTKSVVIPNTVDTGIFFPPSQKMHKAIKKIIFVGLLSPQKGVPYLLRAIKRVLYKRSDFIVDIVGDGPCRKEYENLTNEMVLTDKVIFHGLKTKNKIANFMRSGDFFILPSLYENLPCVIIEALTCGLPILSTKVGGITEMVSEKNGLLIESENVDELVQGITYMLDHCYEYSFQSISSDAVSKYSYHAVGLEIHKVYQEVIHAK